MENVKCMSDDSDGSLVTACLVNLRVCNKYPKWEFQPSWSSKQAVYVGGFQQLSCIGNIISNPYFPFHLYSNHLSSHFRLISGQPDKMPHAISSIEYKADHSTFLARAKIVAKAKTSDQQQILHGFPTEIESKMVWGSGKFKAEEWVIHLTSEHLDEIDSALRLFQGLWSNIAPFLKISFLC
jgi:hypothetical protein